MLEPDIVTSKVICTCCILCCQEKKRRKEQHKWETSKKREEQEFGRKKRELRERNELKTDRSKSGFGGGRDKKFKDRRDKNHIGGETMFGRKRK